MTLTHDSGVPILTVGLADYRLFPHWTISSSFRLYFFSHLYIFQDEEEEDGSSANLPSKFPIEKGPKSPADGLKSFKKPA